MINPRYTSLECGSNKYGGNCCRFLFLLQHNDCCLKLGHSLLIRIVLWPSASSAANSGNIYLQMEKSGDLRCGYLFFLRKAAEYFFCRLRYKDARQRIYRRKLQGIFPRLAFRLASHVQELLSKRFILLLSREKNKNHSFGLL